MTTTLISVSSSWQYGLPVGVEVRVRPSTWGMRGLRKRLHSVYEMVHLAICGGRYDRVVVVTCGWEIIFLYFLRRSSELIVVDWLMPNSSVFKYFPVATRVDRFVVIRAADAPSLSDLFRVDSSRCTFAFFPAPHIDSSVAPAQPGKGDYVYSAGWAHRDWQTLSQALEICRVPAVVSCGEAVNFSANVTRLDPLSPEEGGQYLSKARSLVLAFHETHLPSGPLVLLDGMARGKAIVASRVAGTQDYVTDEVDGLLVEPGDAHKLAAAITRIFEDDALCERLGASARVTAEKFTAERFWSDVFSHVKAASA